MPGQTVDIDNCWMTVNKDDLEISEAELEMVAYNQAMLPSSLKFKVRLNFEKKTQTNFLLHYAIEKAH